MLVPQSQRGHGTITYSVRCANNCITTRAPHNSGKSMAQGVCGGGLEILKILEILEISPDGEQGVFFFRRNCTITRRPGGGDWPPGHDKLA